MLAFCKSLFNIYFRATNNITSVKKNMRKIFALLLLLIPAFCLKAQSLKVTEFVKDVSDLSARVTDPMYDQNGDKCALIKIQTTITNFAFEGDMLGISKIEQKTGEVWVYIPAKAIPLTNTNNLCYLYAQNMGLSGLKKYYAGKFTELNVAKDYAKQLDKSGFSGAFVVPFYKGKPITHKEAELIK